MSKIVAIQRDDTGSISKFKLDNGEVITKDEAVGQAEAGLLDGVSAFTTRNGDRAIRSNRGQADYSLDDLPEF